MSSFKCPISINAQVSPENIAVISGRKRISYRELNTVIWEIAKRLRALGIKPGDRVVIIEPATYQHVLVLWATWRIGASACPFSTHLPEFMVGEYLEEIRAKFLISSQDRILDIPTHVVKKISFDYFLLQNADVEPNTQVAIFPVASEATVLLTSGSSSRPKPAILSFQNYFSNAKGANEHIPVKKNDRWLLSLPLYHVSGLGILFRTFLAGATVVIHDTDQPIDEAMELHHITHVSLVPAQLKKLLETKKSLFAFREVKAILIGGSTTPDALIEKSLEAKLPIFLTYGLTEMASQVATSEIVSCDPQNPRSLQKAVSDLKTAKILNFSQVKISPDHEIFVKGDPLFVGYVSGEGCDRPVDSDGWFPTGDLGEIVDYHYLKIHGRKDNMFISGGENIQPEEIEGTLYQLPGVQTVLVIPKEDEAFGFRPIAFLETLPGYSLGKEQAAQLLQQRLPKYKWPQMFFSWPDILKGSEMKISRETFKESLKKSSYPQKLFELS